MIPAEPGRIAQPHVSFTLSAVPGQFEAEPCRVDTFKMM